jgi:hypothetical protein
MINQRNKIWIDRFQTQLLIRIVAYFVVYQIIATAFIALCEQLYSTFVAQGASGSYLHSVLFRSLVALVIIVPPMTVDAIRFAHRLVGPLYRFRKVMQSIAAGEPLPGPVKLRKGDLLIDFQDDFNAMLAQLEQQGFVLMKKASLPAGSERPEIAGSLTPHHNDAEMPEPLEVGHG